MFYGRLTKLCTLVFCDEKCHLCLMQVARRWCGHGIRDNFWRIVHLVHIQDGWMWMFHEDNPRHGGVVSSIGSLGRVFRSYVSIEPNPQIILSGWCCCIRFLPHSVWHLPVPCLQINPYSFVNICCYPSQEVLYCFMDIARVVTFIYSHNFNHPLQ